MMTYDLDQLEHLAAQFADGNNASSDPPDSSAIRYRMYLSMFLIYLRNQADSDGDNVLEFQLQEDTYETHPHGR